MGLSVNWGDTVGSEQGVVLSVTALGTLPRGRSGLRRDLAVPGDDIWVSGNLGAADVALKGLSGLLDLAPERLAALRSCLEQPVPRIAPRSCLVTVSACGDRYL